MHECHVNRLELKIELELIHCGARIEKSRTFKLIESPESLVRRGQETRVKGDLAGALADLN